MVKAIEALKQIKAPSPNGVPVKSFKDLLDFLPTMSSCSLNTSSAITPWTRGLKMWDCTNFERMSALFP